MSSNITNEIIGQDKLLNKINSYDIDTFPHSIILEGLEGSGKHSICNYIAEHLGLELVNIDSNLNAEEMENLISTNTPSLYVVDVTKTILKYQSSVLKIIEEPLPNTFFVCLCHNKHCVLPTLLNRCDVWTLETYNEAQLRKIAGIESESLVGEIALALFHTPGQVKRALQHPLDKIYQLAIDILNRAGTVSIPNMLSIADKIAFKDEKNKFDLDIFVRALEVEAYNRVADSSEDRWVAAYNLVSHLPRRLDFCISKQRTLEGFLIELKETLSNDASGIKAENT